jgi:hypothetical protein
MNLIRYAHRQDYGHDWYVQILNTGRHVPRPFRDWTLLQLSFSTCEHPGWPYIQIKSGAGSGLSILVWAWKLGFDIDILSHTWKYEYLDRAADKVNEQVGN